MIKLNIGEKVNTFHILMLVAVQFIGAVAWAVNIDVRTKDTTIDIKELREKTDEISVIKNDIQYIKEAQRQLSDDNKMLMRAISRVDQKL